MAYNLIQHFRIPNYSKEKMKIEDFYELSHGNAYNFM